MANHPTSNLVTIAWLKTLPELAAAGVASRLPKDTAGWSAGGFVQVSTVGGGGGVYSTQLRQPVVSIDTWAVASGSGQPPAGKANQLAEIVRAATERTERFPALVQPGPGDYLQAQVLGAYLLQTEPREVPDPVGSYAHFTFDLGLMWVEAPS